MSVSSPTVLGLTGVVEIKDSMVQGTRNFRQFRAAESVIPYILYVSLYCLRCCDVWKVPCPPLYTLGGHGYIKILDKY